MKDCIAHGKTSRPDGYGQVCINRKYYLAHRLAYCEAHGLDIEDIDGMVVMHLCDNPPCVNPAHLELGTNANNLKDMTDKGRRYTKLTHDDVILIYRHVKDGGTSTEMARRFGVSHACVQDIKHHRSWSHLTAGVAL